MSHRVDVGTEPDQHALWGQQRARLLRICTRLTGDSRVAEDLVQETLLEAWRHRDALRVPERFPQWLAGIARNICFRWARQHQRDLARVRSLPHEADEVLAEYLVDGDLIEIELERHELAAILDAALAILPAETRTALLAHYVEDLPLATIATRLGVQTGAVAMRLQRGKLAMRRALSPQRDQGPATVDRVGRGAGAWEETGIWCPNCGRRRLQGQYRREIGELLLRCPARCSGAGGLHSRTRSLPILGGVRGSKRANDRLLAWVDRYYRPHLPARSIPCATCGRLLPLEHGLPAQLAPALTPSSVSSAGWDPSHLHHTCPSCRISGWESRHHLLWATPAVRAFARGHVRICTIPAGEVEADGRRVIVTRFESIASADRLVALSDAETFELVRVGGTPI